jgi:putative membrane protein insertion efficiency factor
MKHQQQGTECQEPGVAEAPRPRQGLSRGLTALLVGIIRVYQVFSRMSPPRCRFYPSCSHYAVDALRGHGPWRGSGLALKRLGRCHPWNPGGYDPVP